ncbi:peptidase C60, sortase A and B [Alloactinosynnema sp. L-07]|uniref:class F sortase n=1 Tax=Alloactinosynnema sp. L-07 TaxID=1653480 RepID=UPI00065EFDE6|nr:class F sortase [Alloactinosynnema sp. L-07]CRK59467.1 peptidase C60, sortase A and B [Alloactinosynnema sp. L-07]
MSRRGPVSAAAAVTLLVAAVAAVTFGGPGVVSGVALAAGDAPEPAAGVVGAVVPAPTSAPPVTTIPETTAQPTPTPTATPSPAAPKPPAAQSPGTVRLAKGGTATLVRRDLGPDASLPIPDGVREATWWGAALDAGKGATVLAGHVNWKGQTGPFSELWESRKGDITSIVDPAGRMWRFRVERIETVAKHDLPARAEEFFGQTGAHRLVLVTCGGRWVGGSSGYESNRVVIAVPA